LAELEFYLIPGKLGFSVNTHKNEITTASKYYRNDYKQLSEFKILCFCNNKEIKMLNGNNELKRINSSIEPYMNKVKY
jgi:hypothetical protein